MLVDPEKTAATIQCREWPMATVCSPSQSPLSTARYCTHTALIAVHVHKAHAPHNKLRAWFVVDPTGNSNCTQRLWWLPCHLWLHHMLHMPLPSSLPKCACNQWQPGVHHAIPCASCEHCAKCWPNSPQTKASKANQAMQVVERLAYCMPSRIAWSP